MSTEPVHGRASALLSLSNAHQPHLSQKVRRPLLTNKWPVVSSLKTDRVPLGSGCLPVTLLLTSAGGAAGLSEIRSAGLSVVEVSRVGTSAFRAPALNSSATVWDDDDDDDEH